MWGIFTEKKEEYAKKLWNFEKFAVRYCFRRLDVL